jgi:hypothetical protein
MYQNPTWINHHYTRQSSLCKLARAAVVGLRYSKPALGYNLQQRFIGMAPMTVGTEFSLDAIQAEIDAVYTKFTADMVAATKEFGASLEKLQDKATSQPEAIQRAFYGMVSIRNQQHEKELLAVVGQ